MNAVIVAEQLEKKGVECTFVASPYAEHFLKGKNFDYFIFGNDKRKNMHHIKKMIETGFDVTVIADYYLFFVDKQLPKFLWIGFLEDMDVTTITFDSLGLGREFPANSYVISPELFPPRKYNILYKIPSFVEALIYPCPPFSGSGGSHDIHCGRLYEEDFTGVIHDKSRIRQELGIPEEVKVLFHPIPKWSLATQETRSMKYYPLLGDIITLQLSKLDIQAQIVCINPSDIPVYHSTHNVSVQELEFIPYDLFMKYLLCADLLITDNILSATLGKAVLNRVPALLLGNLHSYGTASTLDAVDADVSSFIQNRMGNAVLPSLPFWSAFKDSYAARDIQETFLQEELLNTHGIFTALKTILTDPHTRSTLRENQDEYIRKIQSLPTMADIVLSFT
ncbi:MAG: hypothetical protein HXS51_04920 [Theionarchaea archaeon]|nr:hypothetical protein [Theionarchaea archaeon]